MVDVRVIKLPVGLILEHRRSKLDIGDFQHSGFYSYLGTDVDRSRTARESFTMRAGYRDSLGTDMVLPKSIYGEDNDTTLYVIKKSIELPVLWKEIKRRKECIVGDYISEHHLDLSLEGFPMKQTPLGVYLYDHRATGETQIIRNLGQYLGQNIVLKIAACSGAKCQSFHTEEGSLGSTNARKFIGRLDAWEGADVNGEVELFMRKETAEDVLHPIRICMK